MRIQKGLTLAITALLLSSTSALSLADNYNDVLVGRVELTNDILNQMYSQF